MNDRMTEFTAGEMRTMAGMMTSTDPEQVGSVLVIVYTKKDADGMHELRFATSVCDEHFVPFLGCVTTDLANEMLRIQFGIQGPDDV